MTDSAAQRNGGWIPLLFPILVGLAALASIEFSGVMGWLLVQPTSVVLGGLILLSGVVLLLSRSVANLSEQSRGLGRFQLVVPTLLVDGAAKLPQLDLLPAFLGFLLYKPALILQHVFDS